MPEAGQPATGPGVDEPLRRHNPKRADENDLAEQVRRSARKAAQYAWGKKPVTRVDVVWV